MESTTDKCPGCGSSAQAPVLQSFTEPILKMAYRLHRCPACDLEFWSPLVMPDPSYYEQARGDDYEHYHKGDLLSLRWWHQAFLEGFPSIDTPRTILDVGCADGRFLSAMQARGWTVYGLDFDSRSVEVARKACGEARIFLGSMDEAVARFEAGSFDVVTFFEVLEHQTDPIRFLEQVKSLLRPGGIIGGSVPNRDRYVAPTRYSPDLPPHHFTLWSGDVLRGFFERHGFSQVQISLAWYEPNLLDQVVRHVLRRPLAALKSKLSVRSFESADYAPRGNAVARLLTAAKRTIWNPVMAILTLPEYPLLWLSRNRYSLCFLAHMADGAREELVSRPPTIGASRNRAVDRHAPIP